MLPGLALDPIEKKPLARFHPGKKILSAGGFGCNMLCDFCQNYNISRVKDDNVALSSPFYSAKELVQYALDLRPRGNIGIAFTYNEPLINFEYIAETFILARKNQLETILITNGSFKEEPIREISKYTTAWNIDLKCFRADGYRELAGDFELVKSTIEIAARTAHLEVTTLVIPGFSDDEEEMREMTGWLAGINRDIPYHISRYFPRYKRSYPPATPLDTMQKLKEIASRKLNTVLLGNV